MSIKLNATVRTTGLLFSVKVAMLCIQTMLTKGIIPNMNTFISDRESCFFFFVNSEKKAVGIKIAKLVIN